MRDKNFDKISLPIQREGKGWGVKFLKTSLSRFDKIFL